MTPHDEEAWEGAWAAEFHDMIAFAIRVLQIGGALVAVYVGYSIWSVWGAM